jgi:hypothetical protein
MSDLKNDLQQLFNKLKGVEERARKLKNQNLADIAASAHGKVKQLSDHPDLELVDEKKDQQARPDGTLKADPNAPKTKEEAIASYAHAGDTNPENSARMRWPHLFTEPAPLREPPHSGAQQWPGSQPVQPRPLGADEYQRS